MFIGVKNKQLIVGGFVCFLFTFLDFPRALNESIHAKSTIEDSYKGNMGDK